MLWQLVLLPLLPVLAAGPYPIDDCTAYASGYLVLAPGDAEGPTFVQPGFIPGVHRHGLDNSIDRLLVTQHANGSALPAMQWDFLNCPSLYCATPDWYMDDSPVPALDCGLLRPSNAGNNSCLYMLSDVDDHHKNSTNVYLLSNACDQIPSRYSTFYLQQRVYADEYNSRLWYYWTDQTPRVSNTTHGEVYSVYEHAGHGQDMHFLLSISTEPLTPDSPECQACPDCCPY